MKAFPDTLSSHLWGLCRVLPNEKVRSRDSGRANPGTDRLSSGGEILGLRRPKSNPERERQACEASDPNLFEYLVTQPSAEERSDRTIFFRAIQGI